MKIEKVLFIAAIICVAIGASCLIASFILSRFGYAYVSDGLLLISALAGVASIILLIFRLTKTVKNATPEQPKVVIKVVDVKDLPKSKEQKLYEQYEDLYKQGLITEEDLKKKKEELLGK